MRSNKIKRWIPERDLINAALDSSTAIRLFKGNWNGTEIKIYQNLLKPQIVPTVYKEFFNYQDASCFACIGKKERFLQLLGAKIWYPETENDLEDNISMDRQIICEVKQLGIHLLITDNIAHFKLYQCEFPDIEIINGYTLIFSIIKQENKQISQTWGKEVYADL